MSPSPSKQSSGPLFTRRRLLQISGGVGIALAGGGLLMMRGSSEHYRKLLPRGGRPQVLSEKELAVLAALCDRLFLDEPGWPTARDAGLALRLDRELLFHTPKFQSDFKAGLLLIEHGGLLHLSPARFTRRSPGEQDAYLKQMALGTDLERQAFSGLRLAAVFFYYCDERTWASIHYGGPQVTRKAPEADSRVELGA